MTTKLYAPPDYWTDPDSGAMPGGCGPGRIGDWFVPDTIYLVSIRDACKIHDFMYALGETRHDKDEADRVFLNNMIRLINDNRFLKSLNFLRRLRARTYYRAVRDFGGPSFWSHKNPPAEFQAP